MAVKRKKRARRVRRRLLHAVKGGTFRLRKEPQTTTAPVDEEPSRAGILRFDSEEWRLPEALAEEAGEDESNGVMPGRVVLVISILAIIFIAIMAWFVSQMPEK